MKFAYLSSVGLSDIGRKRENNEDAVLLLPEHGVFCVADGMGGAEEGEVASQAIVEGLRDDFTSMEGLDGASTVEQKAGVVQKSLNKVSSWIRKRSEKKDAPGTGSTAVVLVFDGGSPHTALTLHAGDSRAYRFRKGRLEQLTKDHSIAEALKVDDERAGPIGKSCSILSCTNIIFQQHNQFP